MIIINSIELVDLINLFFYPLQKNSKEKLLLTFNIIGNNIGRRCTCSHLARQWMQTKLFYLLIRLHLPVLRTVTLHLPNGLHCLLIFSLPKFHFLGIEVQLFGKHRNKGYFLLEHEVHLILYGLHMYVCRPACSLREMSILRSIQELAMTWMGDHICLTCNITNPSVESTSWSNGYMDLFHLKNSSEGFGSEDVDLNVPDGLGAFMGYLSDKIFWLLLIV
jgi:hypothetical protein